MTAVTENTAIRTIFNTGWGATTPVAYENEPFTPPTDASYAVLNVKPDDAFQNEIGSPGVQFRHPGLIFVMIFSPPDTGNNAALALADTAAAIFRRKRSTIVDGRILYRSPSIKPIGLTDEGWFQVNVTIPYIRDEFFL